MAILNHKIEYNPFKLLPVYSYGRRMNGWWNVMGSIFSIGAAATRNSVNKVRLQKGPVPIQIHVVFEWKSDHFVRSFDVFHS